LGRLAARHVHTRQRARLDLGVPSCFDTHGVHILGFIPDGGEMGANLLPAGRDNGDPMTGRADDDAIANEGYAKALGARLRAVRLQQHLSLHGVERKSGGRWKAVVVGSYERGDRAVSVQRLAELADFYGVAVSDLLPPEESPFVSGSPATPLSRIVLNLEKVGTISDAHADILRRFVSSIQRQRGNTGTRTMPVRHEDLRTLALMYDTSIESLTDRRVRWRVLAPESVIVDSE
jgi:transcriptional regulator with XRE-family HTH domain